MIRYELQLLVPSASRHPRSQGRCKNYRYCWSHACLGECGRAHTHIIYSDIALQKSCGHAGSNIQLYREEMKCFTSKPFIQHCSYKSVALFFFLFSVRGQLLQHTVAANEKPLKHLGGLEGIGVKQFEVRFCRNVMNYQYLTCCR